MAKRGQKAASANDTEAAAANPIRPPRFTLKPSKQTCIILGVLMGMVLTGTGALIVWQKGEIDAIQVVVDQKQAQVASGERVALRLQNVETAYAEMQGKLRFLETSVTPGEYVPTLLKQMEGLARSVNLKVASVRPKLEPAPQPPADKEARKKWKPQDYDRLVVDMEVSGSYWSVAKLMYRLTEFPKILSVDTVELSPQGQENELVIGQSPNLNVRMKVIGFIFPNDGVSVETAPTESPAGPAAATPGKPAPAAARAAVTAPATPSPVAVRTAQG